MLSWLSTGAFWLLTAVLPISLFYFLRMRFRRQPISSNYIWSRLKKEGSGGSRLKYRSVLLLILQILTALALAAAAARPVWEELLPQKAAWIFLMDASGSMSVAENGKSRWDEAVARLDERMKKLPGGTEVMVFLCSSHAAGLGEASKNRDAILRKILQIKPYSSSFQENSVSEDVGAWLSGHRDKIWNACLITDGGLDGGGQRLSSLFPQKLETIPVGSNGGDIGVTALRRVSREEFQFYLINSFTDVKQATAVLEKDGSVIKREQLAAAPGKSLVAWKGFSDFGSGLYEIRLEGNQDSYGLDDSYALALNQDYPVDVLLTGAENPFLSAALKNPRIELARSEDLNLTEIESKNFDVVIANEISIPTNWVGNLFCFNTAQPGAPVQLGGPSDGVFQVQNASHPLFRFVNSDNWNFYAAKSLRVASDAESLAKLDDKTVLAAWEKNGYHYAVLGADLSRADIGLSSGFPMLIWNFIKWSVPQSGNDLAYTLSAGETAILRATPDWHWVKTNSVIPLRRNGPMLQISSGTIGRYYWKDGLKNGSLAVNLPASELDTDVREIVIPGGEKPAVVENRQKTDLSLPAVIVLLVLLMVEWFFWRGKSPGKTKNDLRGN